MLFCERLKYLLKLYKVSNIKLARKLQVDPSLISRFVSGKRIPSVNAGYIENISAFLSSYNECCYQVQMLLEATGASLPENNQKFENSALEIIIKDWLYNSPDICSEEISDTESSTGPKSHDSTLSRNRGKKVKVEMLQGREGIWEAMLHFFEVVHSEDRNVSVMMVIPARREGSSKDDGYLSIVIKGMQRLVDHGYVIKAVFEFDRKECKRFIGSYGIMPLLDAGKVEVFCAEKSISDIMFAVLPDRVCAVSVLADNIEDTCTYMHSDKVSVRLFTEKFNKLSARCRPFFHVYKSDLSINNEKAFE